MVVKFMAFLKGTLEMKSAEETEKKTMGSGVGGAAKSRRLRVKRWERQHEEDSDLLCG